MIGASTRYWFFLFHEIASARPILPLFLRIFNELLDITPTVFFLPYLKSSYCDIFTKFMSIPLGSWNKEKNCTLCEKQVGMHGQRMSILLVSTVKIFTHFSSNKFFYVLPTNFFYLILNFLFSCGSSTHYRPRLQARMPIVGSSRSDIYVPILLHHYNKHK